MAQSLKEQIKKIPAANVLGCAAGTDGDFEEFEEDEENESN